MNYFRTLARYCEAINIPPPKHPHFDIRNFEENMPTVVHQMPPFRHAFYAIAIKIGGGGKVISGHHSDFPDGSVIFFNSPFQILSWNIAPDWKGYYVMMTQDFLAQSIHFNHLLEDFPFLKIEQAMPFKIDKKDVKTILSIYEKIYEEYHSANPDKFNFVETFVLLLLNYIKRYFSNQVDAREAEKVLRTADVKLLSRYTALIESRFRPDAVLESPQNLHSPSFYAKELNVHPNHLNAVVKKISGRTALQHIHQHILQLAKSQLAQTTHSIKEIAYILHFDSPNNFSSFFKKNTQQTPGAYRKSTNL